MAKSVGLSGCTRKGSSMEDWGWDDYESLGRPLGHDGPQGEGDFALSFFRFRFKGPDSSRFCAEG